MRQVLAKVQGLCCIIPKGVIDGDLTARTDVKKRIYGGKNNGRFKNTISYDPVYFEIDDKWIACGIGALLFLAKNNPLISVEFASIDPPRTGFRTIAIPPQLIESAKWKVNGKERYYFHEALQACRKNHCGTVKLPTGSGKTSIALTLAYNQAAQLGTGIIIVPSHTIKDQFIKSAREFGIKVADYRDWLVTSEYELMNVFPEILITTPTILHNDIIEVRKWVSHNSEKDMRDTMYKHQGIKWIIGDEVHHAGCNTWITIFLGLRNLIRSHGFSALPVELNSQCAINFASMSIEDSLTISIVGPVIYEKTTKELQDFLNIPRLINLRYDWPKGLDHKTDDWVIIRGLINQNKERIALIAGVVRMLIDRGYNTITHVAEKEFGTELLAAVGSSKCVCWYGQNETVSNNRTITVDELRQQAGNEILGMVATSHAIEGLDLDSPLNAIVLTDGKKPRQVLQKCGRITRPDKRHSVIVNIVDHGIWVLPRHSEQRRDVILDEFDSDVYEVESLSQLAATLDLIEGIAHEEKTVLQGASL